MKKEVLEWYKKHLEEKVDIDFILDYYKQQLEEKDSKSKKFIILDNKKARKSFEYLRDDQIYTEIPEEVIHPLYLKYYQRTLRKLKKDSREVKEIKKSINYKGSIYRFENKTINKLESYGLIESSKNEIRLTDLGKEFSLPGEEILEPLTAPKPPSLPRKRLKIILSLDEKDRSAQNLTYLWKGASRKILSHPLSNLKDKGLILLTNQSEETKTAPYFNKYELNKEIKEVETSNKTQEELIEYLQENETATTKELKEWTDKCLRCIKENLKKLTDNEVLSLSVKKTPSPIPTEFR